MLGTVRAETRELLRTSSQYERAVTRLLGPEGARRGADAVLAESFEDGRSLTVSVVDPRSGSSDVPAVTVEGRAIRYVAQTCG